MCQFFERKTRYKLPLDILLPGDYLEISVAQSSGPLADCDNYWRTCWPRGICDRRQASSEGIFRNYGSTLEIYGGSLVSGGEGREWREGNTRLASRRFLQDLRRLLTSFVFLNHFQSRPYGRVCTSSSS